jgi:hypothetical protein
MVTDWAATGSMIQGLGTMAGAVAVYAAAKLGFASWRRQKIAERNRDEAELILKSAYKARRALRYIRSPWMSGHEKASAEARLDSDHPEWRDKTVREKQARLITAQAYFDRIHNYREERQALEECLPMALALFGKHVEEAIENLNHQFHIVGVYAESYIDDYNGNDREFTVKIRRALFSSGAVQPGEENEISDSIEGAIRAIEAVCIPHLKLSTL